MNNTIKEDSMHFLRQKEHEVMHLIDQLGILNIFGAPFWEQLLTD